MLKKQFLNSTNAIITYLILVCFFIRLPFLSNKSMILLGIIVCCVFAFTHKRVLFNIRELLLIISLTAYALITHRNALGCSYIILLPTIFAFIGKYLIYDLHNHQQLEKAIRLMICTIVIGYSIHGILNSILFLQNGFSQNGRAWLDIWDGTAPAATLQVLYFLPVISLFFPGLLMIQNHSLVSISILLTNVFFLYISIITMSRIPLVIWGIILIIDICFEFVFNHKRLNWGKIKKIFIPVGIMLIIISIAILWFYMNNDELTSQFSWLKRNGGIINNIRFKAQIHALMQLFVYPMGGYQMELAGLSYAHNLWLDLANAAGLIAFIPFTLYTFLSLIDFCRFLLEPNITFKMKFAVGGLYFSFLLYFLIETPLEASVLNILPWCYMNGTLHGYQLISKNKIKE